MTVYVDDSKMPYRGMIMCHMVADSTEGLQMMAHAIGVSKDHIQKEGKPEEHFDVCQTMRRKAVKYGAKEITTRQMVAIVRMKRLAPKEEHEQEA